MSLTCWTTLPRLRGSPHPQLRPPGVCGCLSPKRGWQRGLGPAQPGGGRGSWKGPGSRGGGCREGRLVTWANLPQGNEVSSRLLGGNGGGRIRPPLTQAGRGISPRSLQPNPFPPPPARSARRNQRSAEGVARPPCLPQGLGFLSVPASLPPPSSPESRNRPTWGGAEGRGGCHPMGSGLAAKRRGSRGRRRARSAHLIREAACGGPLAPPEFRSRAQPERWRAPTCPPPRVLQSTPPPRALD